jgi:HlyD family secretion protein
MPCQNANNSGSVSVANHYENADCGVNSGPGQLIVPFRSLGGANPHCDNKSTQITGAIVKKLFISLALVFAALAAGAMYWQHVAARSASDGALWQPMEYGSITETVSATGVLQPREVVVVGTELAGKVAEVLVDVPAAVEKDQPLCRMDDRLARLRVKQAEVAVELAKADVGRAEAARDAAKVAVQRANDLLKAGGQQRDVDVADAALRSAEATVHVAGVKVQEAEAALQLAEHGLALTTVRSPLAGVVIDRRVTAGQQIGPPISAMLFTVAADLARMEVVAQVAEGDIGRLKAGLPASFTVNSFPDVTFHGAVKQVKPVPTTVQGAVFYPVIVAAENAKDPTTGEWRLRPGMPAAVELVLRTHENVWKLPLAARGVMLEPNRIDEAAKAKLARWEARPDRPDWQLVWARDGEKPVRPLFLKLAGTQDGQFAEVQSWDPDEPGPDQTKPARVLIAAPAEKQSAGLKLF